MVIRKRVPPFTQVEFPEARIYEETLNILLYENREVRPDAELMMATRGPSAATGHQSDDDDDRMHRFRAKWSEYSLVGKGGVTLHW